MTTTSDFTLGDHVHYARADEDGIVTSTTANYVFVRFYSNQIHGLACRPDDLTLIPKA